MHVHVRRAEATAKFWIEPQVVLVESYGLSGNELSELAKVVEDNRKLIEGACHEFFG